MLPCILVNKDFHEAWNVQRLTSVHDEQKRVIRSMVVAFGKVVGKVIHQGWFL